MNAVQPSLSSPRFTRILFWVGVALLIAAIVVFVIKRSGDSSSSSAAPSTPAKQSALNPNALQGKRQTEIHTNKKWSQLDPSAKAAVRTFIFDGAGEHNLARAWHITAPSIRQGFTYKQWVHGNE